MLLDGARAALGGEAHSAKLKQSFIQLERYMRRGDPPTPGEWKHNGTACSRMHHSARLVTAEGGLFLFDLEAGLTTTEDDSAGRQTP